jgi:hypothetical protein
MADSSVPAAEERLIRRVIARFRCAQCHRQHSATDVAVMGRYEAVWIVGVDCDGCRQPDMFVVSMRRDSSYERITDLTEEEQDKFLAARSVDAKDVDHIRDFLQDFKGDFGRIFGAPPDSSD